MKRLDIIVSFNPSAPFHALFFGLARGEVRLSHPASACPFYTPEGAEICLVLTHGRLSFLPLSATDNGRCHCL